MDQKIFNLKCCAGIKNPRCRRVNLRNLTPSIIEQIHSMGYAHDLDETMRICGSCRLVIRNNRSAPTKKRRSGGDVSNQVPDDPQPSTSGQNIDDVLGKKIDLYFKQKY